MAAALRHATSAAQRMTDSALDTVSMEQAACVEAVAASDAEVRATAAQLELETHARQAAEQEVLQLRFINEGICTRLLCAEQKLVTVQVDARQAVAAVRAETVEKAVLEENAQRMCN